MNYSKHRLLKLLIKEYQRTTDRTIEAPKLIKLYTENRSAFLMYEYLKAEDLIDYSVDNRSGEMYGLTLTDKAILYFSYTYRDNFRFWFPVSLSIAALIVSIAALFS